MDRRRPRLLGIDVGTSSVKVMAFDLDLRVVARADRPLTMTNPSPGWVEQDAGTILDAVVDGVASVLTDDPGEVVACGIDHQGESVVAWDPGTGAPLSPVVVWQDKRVRPLLSELDAGVAREVVERSGLPLDPYFCAGKLAWLLERGGVPRTGARLGTLDAFLSDRLGAGHATDASTLSRTQLSGVVGGGGTGWDRRLLDIFGIPESVLPRVGPSAGALGTLHHPRWPGPLPLHARLVDQQAALAGTGCVRPGLVKATYGTGVFVLANVGRDRPDVRCSGLLPTVAWRIGDEDTFALDGGVFSAGALLGWLSDGLGLASDAAGMMRLAASVSDEGGVRVLPALAGLGAPWWRPDALGVIAGIRPDTGPQHIARAAVSAITWRVVDIVAAIDGVVPVGSLRMDGGLSAEPLLPRLQADALGIPVEPVPADATCLGIAGMAAVGAGIWADLDEIGERVRPLVRIEPATDPQERAARHAAWRRFVARAADLPG